MRVDGGCHCGKITYEADIDPDKAGLCHCTDCQTLTSSAFSLFVPVPKENFRLRGEPRVYVKTAESGNRRAQRGSGPCGSERRSRPRAQIWCRSALPWVNGLSSVPQHAKQPM